MKTIEMPSLATHNRDEFDRVLLHNIETSLVEPDGQKNTDSLATKANPLPIPEQLLQEISRDYEGIWKIADAVRQSRIDCGETWPAHSFLPLDGWGSALLELQPNGQIPPNLKDVFIRSLFSLDFIGAWRLARKIYRFEPTLYKALMNTSLLGEIPCETLKRLPEWALYIETPDLDDSRGAKWDGFGASICYNSNGQCSLKITLMRRQSNQVLIMEEFHVHLVAGMTLENTLKNSFKKIPDMSEEVIEHHLQVVSGCVSLVLWLCSEEPDMSSSWKPSKPAGQKTKRGVRHFPAEKLTTWNVGVRIGAALEMAAEKPNQETPEWKGGTHASPRGHVRRAHWHTYRTGPNGGIPVVKWMSQILVNLGGQQSFPITVSPVL